MCYINIHRAVKLLMFAAGTMSVILKSEVPSMLNRCLKNACSGCFIFTLGNRIVEVEVLLPEKEIGYK